MLTGLIWTIIVVLLALWLLGLLANIGGSLIFLLLLLATAGVVYQLLARGMSGGRPRHGATEVSDLERHDA